MQYPEDFLKCHSNFFVLNNRIRRKELYQDIVHDGYLAHACAAFLSVANISASPLSASEFSIRTLDAISLKSISPNCHSKALLQAQIIAL